MSTNLLIRALGCALTVAMVAPSALAQIYPTKPIRLVVAYPPGGTADLVARTLGQPLGAALGQNIVVENRTGGNTLIAAEFVARAPADGYTMLMTGFAFVSNAALRTNMPFDSQRDFTPVARIESSPWMLAVHPSTPFKNIKDLIALAKARPGMLTYASNPAGSGSHLVGAMLKLATKVNILDVPYQGEVPAMIAVMGGHADMLIALLPTVAPQMNAGKLRVLAVTSRARLESYKDIPTLAESGVPDFELVANQGISVPAGTPAAIVNRLSGEITRAVGLPAVRESLVRQGLTPAPLPAADYEALMRAELGRIQKTGREANIRLN